MKNPSIILDYLLSQNSGNTLFFLEGACPLPFLKEAILKNGLQISSLNKNEKGIVDLDFYSNIFEDEEGSGEGEGIGDGEGYTIDIPIELPLTTEGVKLFYLIYLGRGYKSGTGKSYGKSGRLTYDPLYKWRVDSDPPIHSKNIYIGFIS